MSRRRSRSLVDIDYSCNGCAQFPNLKPIWVIHVLPKRLDSPALGRLRLGIECFKSSQQQIRNYKEDSWHRTPLSLQWSRRDNCGIGSGEGENIAQFRRASKVIQDAITRMQSGT